MTAAPGSGLVVGAERVFLAAGFGARLRAERKSCGMTQAGLSAATSIRRQNISKFETGQLRPRASTIETLARALRPGRSTLAAQTLALELMAAAGSSVREDRGQRARRRRRALARYERALERLERDPAWLAPVVSLHGPTGPADSLTGDEHEDDGWADDPVSPRGAPALSLVRHDPSPDGFTLGMWAQWPRVQLLDELRKLPWPDQIAATARVFGESAEEAEDRLWELYRAPGAPSPH